MLKPPPTFWAWGWLRATERRRSIAFLPSLLAACLAGCGPNAGHDARGFNLMLVTLDTVRADHVGCYGSSTAATPALDRLAREGVRFERATSSAPLTLPSHATILSGLLPPHHGLRQNGTGTFPAGRETLATRLAAAGYRTGAFVGAFVLDRRFGLARGFEHYDDDIERVEVTGAGALEAERPGSVVVDRALAWLEKADPRPFFLWVHLYDAHAPYAPPEPFRTRYREHLYDGEVAAVDAQVGRLLEELDRSGRGARSIVAVVADHGEALGEHGELTHGLLLYEPTLRVPLLVRAPGVIQGGGVVGAVMSLADVAPTLLSLLASPMPAGSALDGRDLAHDLATGAEPAAAVVYAETEYPRIFGWSGIAAARLADRKYIAAPAPELYDLGTDPAETSNLLPGAAAPAELAATVARIREGAVLAPAVPVDAEAREKLASLGYVDATPAAGTSGTGMDPKDAVGLFHEFEEACWALRAGRTEEATRRFERLVAQDAPNPVFPGLLAQAYRKSGDLSRAIELYRASIARAPDDAGVRYDLAVTLRESGRIAEGAAELAEAIRRDPGVPEAHNALGIALAETGHPAEALLEFEKVSTLDPRNAQAHNNRGNILRQLGRMADAEAAFARAVELAPRYADPLSGLGAIELERNRPDAALGRFDAALALAPDSHEIELNRGIALEMMGKQNEALAAYRSFLGAVGDDPTYAGARITAQALSARLESSRPAAPTMARRSDPLAPAATP